MLQPDNLLIYFHQRHRELINEALHRQLEIVASSGRDKQFPRHYETLAALGRHLVNWGEQLQARYDPVELIVCNETSQ